MKLIDKLLLENFEQENFMQGFFRKNIKQRI